jgi:hypothetical protein
LIIMEDGSQLQTLLKDAISKLSEGKTDEAISLLSKARKEIISYISTEPMTPQMYNLLCDVSALTYLGMLHYFAMAQKTTEKLDNIAKLTYLSESLGVCNILEGVLLPLLMVDDNKAKEKFLPLIQLGENCREEIRKNVGKLITTIRNDKSGKTQKYSESIQKIIETVNPGSPEVRALALQLGRRFEAGDFKQARKIYEYVRDEIHYMRDPVPFEDIQSPEITLRRLSGDCDDQAILLCSLLLAIGFEAALLFADTDGDNFADHVYCAVYIPEAPELYKPFANKKIGGKDLHDWIPLDPTSEDLDFGVITFDNLEIKHAFFFLSDRQYLVNEENTNIGFLPNKTTTS